MNSSVRNVTIRVPTDSIHDHITAFATALHLFGKAELAEFLPPKEDPQYLDVLGELVKVDLTHSWKKGAPRSVESYEAQFPELKSKPALLYRIASEEFVMRRNAVEKPSDSDLPIDTDPSENVPTAIFELNARLSALDPETSSKLDIALPAGQVSKHPTPVRNSTSSISQSDFLEQTRPRLTSGQRPSSRHSSEPEVECKNLNQRTEMPKVGEEFLDFFLLGELGRGGFGKVFLAQQGHLAGRLVARKVAVGLFSESQTLAQLQHTHIVPIYSFHHGQPFQAVCMPYLGSTTLAHILTDIRTDKLMPSSGKDLLSKLASRRKNHSSTDSSLSSSTQEAMLGVTPEPSAAPTPAPSSFLELEGMSYVDSILWMAVRLTDGLAHAHERGIIHRDLKPANILITDDGLPMLLDFNLAQDTKLRDAAGAASMGGTLPYMAPEHLRAFQSHSHPVDARSDVYSLGVILFELLTGASPFASYKWMPMRDMIDRMILDRQHGAPRLRELNKDVSPALEAIVLRCLEADPAKRYQTARELQEDLQRQLDHKPLKYADNPSWWERWSKFRRRHPRLTSTASVTAIACVIIASLAGLFVVREDQRKQLAAHQTLTRFQQDAQTTYFFLNARTARDQVDEGERACRAALAHYQILDNPAWGDAPDVKRLPADKQQQLAEEAGQLLVLLAHAQQLAGENEIDPDQRTQRFQAGVQYCSLAGECFKEDQIPQTLWKQQGELFRRLNEREKAEQAFERAKNSALKNAHDRYLAARLLAEAGKFRDAMPLVQEAIRTNPQDYHLHFLEGICHDYLAQHKEAVACYRTCIALKPDFFGAYYNRGLTNLRQKYYKSAIADFESVIRLNPDFREVFVQRALAYQGMGKHDNALADLTTAIERGLTEPRVYFLRSKLRTKTKDVEGAKSDFAEGRRREPTDEASWIARGLAYLPDDPKRALSDFDQALALNPRSLAAMQNKAHVLGKYFKRTQEAVQVLDKAIDLYPDAPQLVAGRGVYLARLGKREAAHKDAEQAMLLDTNPSNVYQIAGIFALTSREEPDDQKEALRLLASALKAGFGHDYLEIDRDLDPIRNSPTFRRVIEASRTLRTTGPAKQK